MTIRVIVYMNVYIAEYLLFFSRPPILPLLNQRVCYLSKAPLQNQHISKTSIFPTYSPLVRESSSNNKNYYAHAKPLTGAHSALSGSLSELNALLLQGYVQEGLGLQGQRGSEVQMVRQVGMVPQRVVQTHPTMWAPSPPPPVMWEALPPPPPVMLPGMPPRAGSMPPREVYDEPEEEEIIFAKSRAKVVRSAPPPPAPLESEESAESEDEEIHFEKTGNRAQRAAGPPAPREEIVITKNVYVEKIIEIEVQNIFGESILGIHKMQMG